MLIQEYYKKCICLSDRENDFITIIFSKHIDIYNGKNLILRYDFSDLNVNGACYTGEKLYCTQNSDNAIYVYESNSFVNKIVLSEYENVTLMNCINISKQWFVIEINNQYLAAYDFINKRELFPLPMGGRFIGMAILDDENAIMVGDDLKRKYDDVGSNDTHTVLCSFRYDISSGDIWIADQLKVDVYVDNWEETHMPRASSRYKMKFPLFDMYLYYWLEELSLSSEGRYVLYYSEDFNGIIISEFDNGNVYRLFVLPEERMARSKYFFNEITNILTIVSFDGVEQYLIKQEAEDRLEKLNEKYNDFYENKKSAQKDDDFKTLFLQCLADGRCEKLEN